MSLKGPTVDTEMDQKVWENIIHDVGWPVSNTL